MFFFFKVTQKFTFLLPIALGNWTKIDCLSGSHTGSLLKHNRADSDQLVRATDCFLERNTNDIMQN